MSSVVIADRYQCPKMDGKYQEQHKILKRKGMKVTQDYVDKMNGHDNGILFIVDEEATQRNHEDRDRKNGIRIEQKKKVALSGNTAAIDALIDRAAGKVTAKVIEPKGSEKPKLVDLRKQYPEIKATSVDAFLAKIKELEQTGERLTPPPTE